MARGRDIYDDDDETDIDLDDDDADLYYDDDAEELDSAFFEDLEAWIDYFEEWDGDYYEIEIDVSPDYGKGK
jgi:hypothetical protein